MALIHGMEGEIPGQSDKFCRLTIPLHSPGLWELPELKNFLNYSLPRLQLQLAVIFLVTQSIHLLLKRFFIPRIVSELLAGIVLGNSLLGQLPYFHDGLFPIEGVVFIELLSKIGFIFFMFLIGVKMDPALLPKTGGKAWSIGLVAVVAPMSLSIGLGSQITSDQNSYRVPAFNNVFGVHTLTPFPVIASLLIDLKIMNSDLGRLTLASTLIADVFSTLSTIGVAATKIGSTSNVNSLVYKTIGLCTLAITLFLLVYRPVFLWMIRKTPEGKPVKRAYVTSVCFMVLLAAVISDNVGLSYQLGPFIVGLCVPDGPPLGSSLVEKLDTLVSGLFSPLIAISCGMKVNMNVIYDLAFVGKLAFCVFTTVGGRIGAIFIPAALCKLPIRDAVVLSLVMSTQGIVQVSFFMDLFNNQTIDGDGFTVVVLEVLFVATFTSVAAKLTYDYSRTYGGYQKRNIIHSSMAELRILACAHRHDDAVAAAKLLEITNPTRDAPIGVYALNLVELVGRATPLLINHKLGQKSNAGGHRSHQMIDLFTRFEEQHSGAITAQVFTGMSLPKFMYHDICSLAFDKSTSLIILPFHKKWNQQGKIVFDSNALRTVNVDVLDNAPCSVGILIDRRRIRSAAGDATLQTRFLVTIVFLGGDDDREALAYAKRMAKSPAVHLTVIRLVAWEDFGEQKQWDTILDTEELKSLRLQAAHQDNIIYKEEKVKDGADTALIINEMQETFDLIIVGRHHKKDSPLLSGLSEWLDLPELGSIGDILAASEIKKPVSFLVIQQQVLRNK